MGQGQGRARWAATAAQQAARAFEDERAERPCLLRSCQSSAEAAARCVAELAANTARVREQLHELVVSQFNLAQNISDFYKEKRLQLREVERFKLSYQRVISSYWNTFVSILYNL